MAVELVETPAVALVVKERSNAESFGDGCVTLAAAGTAVELVESPVISTSSISGRVTPNQPSSYFRYSRLSYRKVSRTLVYKGF